MPTYTKGYKKGGKKYNKKAWNKASAPSVSSLSRRISKVQKKCMPTYLVSDDKLNDGGFPLTSNTIDVSYTWGYKYFGLKWGAAVTDTSILNQGLQEGDIRGNSIRAVSLSVRGQIFLPSTVAIPNPDFTNCVRLIALWDTEAAFYSGGIVNNFPQSTDAPVIYFDGSSGGPGVSSMFGFYNITNIGKGKRFQVLYDKVFTFSRNGNSVHALNFKLKLNKLIGFPAASGANACLAQNVLFAFCSDSAAVPYPQISWSQRLCYVSG